MTPEPTQEQPLPGPPSGFWKWSRRLGCMLILGTLTCCGLTCGGAWLVQDSFRNRNKDEVDRLYVDGMQNGDLRAMHEKGQESFRKHYSLEDLQAFVEAHPGLLDRANLHGMTVARRTIDQIEYVKVSSQPGLFSTEQWEFVFLVVDGEYNLVGISPGLDEAVPEAFRHRTSSAHHRRRHHH
jgi:hypothetical protein